MCTLAIAVVYSNTRELMTYETLLATSVAPIRDGLCRGRTGLEPGVRGKELVLEVRGATKIITLPVFWPLRLRSAHLRALQCSHNKYKNSWTSLLNHHDIGSQVAGNLREKPGLLVSSSAFWPTLKNWVCQTLPLLRLNSSWTSRWRWHVRFVRWLGTGCGIVPWLHDRGSLKINHQIFV